MNIGGLNTTNSAMRSGLAGIKRQSAKNKVRYKIQQQLLHMLELLT